MEVTIRHFITFPQQQKYMFPFQSLEKLAYCHLCYELAITISKYYVDFNTRIDASSKFAVNNQSAIFPSVALSWVISKEKFLRQVDEVSQLKLCFFGGQTRVILYPLINHFHFYHPLDTTLITT